MITILCVLLAFISTINAATVIVVAGGAACPLSTIADVCTFQSQDKADGFSNTYPLNNNINSVFMVTFGDSCRRVNFIAEFLTLPLRVNNVCQANGMVQIKSSASTTGNT